MAEKPNIVILGAGIIGLSTAFFLSESKSHTIHLVDPSPALFQGASGYAGGFLASDWFSSSVAPLGALSYDLHRQVAEQYNGAERWGYSKSETGSLVVRKGKGRRGDEWLREGGSRGEEVETTGEGWTGPAWLRKVRGGELERIGQDDTTAQVNPLKLCEFLVEECRSRGVQVHFPYRCTRIDPSTSPATLTIQPVSKDGPDLNLGATHILFASGPWTPSTISSLLPKRSYPRVPIYALAGHSLVVKSPRWISPTLPDTNTDIIAAKGMPCHAIYTTDPLSGHSPEIFSRSTGEIYIAGLNDPSLKLPEPGKAEPNGKCIDVLKGWAEMYLDGSRDEDDAAETGRESDLSVVRTGLCFRPVSQSGHPLLDRIHVDEKGWEGVNVFIASGHGPWGISLSLGTGKVMSELMLGKETSCDISGLRLRG